MIHNTKKAYLLTYAASTISLASTVLFALLLFSNTFTEEVGKVNEISSDDSRTITFLGFYIIFVGMTMVILNAIINTILTQIFLKKYPHRNKTVLLTLCFCLLTPFVFYLANIMNIELPLTIGWIIAYPGLARFIATANWKVRSR